jgi:hypothetical protein
MRCKTENDDGCERCNPGFDSSSGDMGRRLSSSGARAEGYTRRIFNRTFR